MARSFSGDKKQLLSILKASLSHRGTAMIDVLSPCVTFNDHEGSTKSYAYVRDHDEPLGEVSFVPFFEDISVDYEPGTTTEVKMHDGSKLYLKKVAENYDPTDKHAAMRLLHETTVRGEFATGILYVEPDKEDFLTLLNLVDEPLGDAADRARPAGPAGARRGHGQPPVRTAARATTMPMRTVLNCGLVLCAVAFARALPAPSRASGP